MIVVATASGPAELTVAGIVDRSFPGKSGEAALVGWTDATSKLGVLGADAYVIRFDPARAAAASAEVADLATELALTAAPVSRVEGAQGEALDGVFGLLDLLALAAVVVAGLGIVNTLSMGTWERIRELGVLRAAGMSRRQVWRSVLVEAGILGTIGGIAGSVAGLAVGALLVAFAGSLDVRGSRSRGGRSRSPSSSASRSRCSRPPSPPASPAAARSCPPSGATKPATAVARSRRPLVVARGGGC